VDTADLDEQGAEGGVGKNQVAEVTLHTKAPLALDIYADFQTTGRFVLVDGYDVAGGGIVTGVLADEQQSLRDAARTRDLLWEGGDVTGEARAQAVGHRSAFVLMTGGAPGAAEDAARRLERRLIEEGRHAYLVEMDNLRHGLAADVAATNAAELVRRLGEAGRLLTDAGLLVIAALEGADAGAVETLETLVRPAPFVNTALPAETRDAAPALDATVGELASRGVFLQDDARRQFPYPRYSI
jgi:bifunctional enzyme CysN/CysC